MSTYRPECRTSSKEALPDDTATFLIYESVARRRFRSCLTCCACGLLLWQCSLIYGMLHDGNKHCAMGAFWADNPSVTVHSSLVDEAATVNDSLPPGASPKARWKKRVLAAEGKP